jgi:HSP20 family protein
MIKEMDAMMAEAKNDPAFAAGRPIYYGYSIETGPDGKPIVKEYGNIRPKERPMIKPGAGECGPETADCGCGTETQGQAVPMQQVSDKDECFACAMYDEKKNEYRIHADIPGISKEDIELELKGGKLILNARNEDRNYHSEIELEKEVNERSIKAEYNNGVLEVTLKCKKPKKETSKKINVD